MSIKHIALVPDTPSASMSEVSRVSAALQRQVTRDLAPVWHVQATVDAFPQLEDVPIGYWPIILLDDVKGAAGVHLDRDGQPFALAELGPDWSLTASHECLEMLVDPFGAYVIPGPSPKPGQGRVEFLVEVCDPSESIDFAYTVNGVVVSDFYTTNYFDPMASSGVRYSFTSKITRPREVLAGGYLSWLEPAEDRWWQLIFFDREPMFRDLGRLDSARSPREFTNSQTPESRRIVRPGLTRSPYIATAMTASASELQARSKANKWRATFHALMRG